MEGSSRVAGEVNEIKRIRKDGGHISVVHQELNKSHGGPTTIGNSTLLLSPATCARNEVSKAEYTKASASAHPYSNPVMMLGHRWLISKNLQNGDCGSVALYNRHHPMLRRMARVNAINYRVHSDRMFIQLNRQRSCRGLALMFYHGPQNGHGRMKSTNTKNSLAFSVFACTAALSTCCQNLMSVKIGCRLILLLKNSLKYPASPSAPSPPLAAPVADSAASN